MNKLFSLEAEGSTIGAMLLAPSCIGDVESILHPTDFHNATNREIYKTLLDMDAQQLEIDSITVCEKNPVLQLHAVLHLVNSTASAANVLGYAEIVRQKSEARQLVKIGQELMETQDKEKAEKDLTAINASSEIEVAGPKAYLREFWQYLETRTERDLPGLSTSYAKIDQMLGGLEAGNLVIIAARPSMGKTALALNIADNIAKQGKAIFFSLEMPAVALVRRLMADRACLNAGVIKTPAKLSDAQWSMLNNEMANYRDSGLSIVDKSGIRVSEIRSICRRAKRQDGLDAIFIDYLSLMTLPDADRHDLRIGEATKQLKALANELEIPVVLLSQLNRASVGEPSLKDLRHSGDIEQDADIVMFVHRPHYYDETEPENLAKVIIGKARDGEVGTVTLSWNGPFQRFSQPDTLDLREWELRENRKRAEATKKKKQKEFV